MSVDYRLLHHFRISQRRQMASRGELPARFERPEGELDGFDSRKGAVELTGPSALPPLQVLSHLLNEDR